MDYKKRYKVSFLIEYSLIPTFWRWAISVLLLVSFSSSFAQKVTAVISRDKIRMGEQFDLKLMVAPTSNAPLNVDSWFNIPDTFAHFQVVSRKPIDTIRIASTNSYQQVISLTSFDSGSISLPVFSVIINKKELLTQEKIITVVPIDVSHLKDYNDIKDIIEPIPENNETLIWIAIIGVVILVIIFFFYLKWLLIKRKNQTVLPLKKVSIDFALEQLNALESLIQVHQYQLFCTELISICKSFSDYQLQITTYSKTTAEYILLFKDKINDKHLLQQYSHLLHWTDQVKFAKATPTEVECKKGLLDAKTILKSLASSHEPLNTTANAR